MAVPDGAEAAAQRTRPDGGRLRAINTVLGSEFHVLRSSSKFDVPRSLIMQFKPFGIAALCALALAIPAAAHHSHGNYDLSKWTPMEGTVKQVVLVVPHSIVYMDVKDPKG